MDFRTIEILFVYDCYTVYEVVVLDMVCLYSDEICWFIENASSYFAAACVGILMDWLGSMGSCAAGSVSVAMPRKLASLR